MVRASISGGWGHGGAGGISGSEGIHEVRPGDWTRIKPVGWSDLAGLISRMGERINTGPVGPWDVMPGGIEGMLRHLSENGDEQTKAGAKAALYWLNPPDTTEVS